MASGAFHTGGLFIAALLLATPAASSQDTLNITPDRSTRPSLGLALSGGSALGIAHLGVMKVMEEAGLRPDFITGVSMGSIVGAMYSIGYTVDSLSAMLRRTDWNLLLNNKIPENKITFEEKRHYYNSIISLPVRESKIKLPAGLNNGQQIETMLNYYVWPAADINDFSKLPIPYSCIAVDIITGEKRELRSGYLPDAIRASIAIPSVFTPVRIDSALFVDGGLLRNIAISELKEMGADVIIGSYTGFKPHNDKDLESAYGLGKQIGFFQAMNDFNQEKLKADFIVIPDLKDLSSFDFGNVDTLMERGYKAALPLKDEFRKLADSLNSFAPQLPVANLTGYVTRSFDRIDVEGNEIYSDSQITGILGIQPGETVDRETLRDGIELLYGRGWFEKVRYRIVSRNDSLILVIDCIEKPRVTVRGALHYDNALNAGLLAGLTARNIITRRSEINIDLSAAKYWRYAITLTQFAGRNQATGFSIDLSGDNTLYPYLQLRQEAGKVIGRNFYTRLSISRRIGLNNMMMLSAGIDNLYLIPDYISASGLKSLRYDYHTGSFQIMHNSLNNKHFPDRGIAYDLSASTSKLLSASLEPDTLSFESSGTAQPDFSYNRFYTGCGSIRSYFSPSHKMTFGIRGDLLYISNTDSVTAHNNFFLLGGIESYGKRSIPAAGFHPYEIAVRNLAGLALEADLEVISDVHLSLSINGYAIQDVSDSNDVFLAAGYSIGAGYMSIIGPVKAGIMQGFYRNETGFNRLKGYISLGFIF